MKTPKRPMPRNGYQKSEAMPHPVQKGQVVIKHSPNARKMGNKMMDGKIKKK